MKHYFFGDGEAVNLGDVGLGADFENTAQVDQAIGIAEGHLRMDLSTGGDGSVSGRVPLGGGVEMGTYRIICIALVREACSIALRVLVVHAA